MRPGEGTSIVFDAPPWGGGAILYEDTSAVEHMAIAWDTEFADRFGAAVGDSGCLAFYEAVVVLAAIQAWGVDGKRKRMALIGDNVGALTVAISLRGRGDLAQVCREVALRQARFGLELCVGHLPSERNVDADALSRLAAPSPASFPASLLAVPSRAWPQTDRLFTI